MFFTLLVDLALECTSRPRRSRVRFRNRYRRSVSEIRRRVFSCVRGGRAAPQSPPASTTAQPTRAHTVGVTVRHRFGALFSELIAATPGDPQFGASARGRVHGEHLQSTKNDVAPRRPTLSHRRGRSRSALLSPKAPASVKRAAFWRVACLLIFPSHIPQCDQITSVGISALPRCAAMGAYEATPGTPRRYRRVGPPPHTHTTTTTS